MPTSTSCHTCGSSLSISLAGTFCPVCALRSVEDVVEEKVSVIGDGSLPRAFGNFELLAELGHGGMGLVFKAQEPRLNRIVALKVLLTGRFSDVAMRHRFQREAEAAASLQHPNIVAVHEVGEASGHPYLTMDFVDGPNLAELCGGGPLSTDVSLSHARDIAAAVQAAHEKGILHRDLKPSNVLVGSDGRPRVTDFGLAKWVGDSSDLTLTGQMLGSPNYTSPEQASGRPEDVVATSDIYGIGAIFYHLLTGRAPFSAPTPAETLRLVLDTEPVSPRLLNPAIDRDLETICLKCLAKEPERRYATAADVADEFDRVIAGLPIRARPISGAELGWRWCRRHPAVAGLSATLFVALSLTILVLIVSSRKVEKARAQEMTERMVAQENLYVADMEVIAGGFSSVLGVDARDARLRLEAARPRPGARDLRGFEWRYYWLRNQVEASAVLRGHGQVVDRVGFSPDGSLAVSHSIDGVLKLWDAATGEERESLTGVVRLGGFSADGRGIFFSRPDNSIWRFDLSNGRTEQVLAATGRLIAAHPDGAHVVVFGADQLPVLRQLDKGLPPQPVADVPIDTVAVMSADGRRVAVVGRPYPGILVFDVMTGRQISAMTDPRPVIAMALSADGSRLVSSGFDSVLKVWNVDQGMVEHVFKPFVDPSWGLAFSPDGLAFSAGGHNRLIKVWSTVDWDELESLTGHESTIVALAFSPSGQQIISGAEDELAMLWPMSRHRPRDEIREALRGPSWMDSTPGMAFSPDSTHFVGTAADKTLKVWRTDTLGEVATFPIEARSVAFSPDGFAVLSEGYDGIVRRWSLTDSLSGEEVVYIPGVRIENWQLDPLTPQQRVALVAEQPDAYAACRLCEIPNARDSINHGGPTLAATLALSPGGKELYVGLPDGSVEVWDVINQTRRLSFAAHKLPVTSIAISDDGTTLATGSLDNSTAIWNAASGQLLARIFVHNRPVWALAFSPDGGTLAAGSCDKAIVLCSVTLGRHVATLPLYTGQPEGYEQEVRLLRFSPDGNTLAAALGDGSVRFFRAAPFAVTDAIVAAH